MNYHNPVLLTETLENLNVSKGKSYIDCTLGDGGHTLALLQLGAKVLGIDYSTDSLTRATKRISDAGLSANFTGIQGNFSNIDNLAQGQVDGILYDLGYSSTQLDEDESGLSFLKDQPLDMRIDKTLGVTAADLINSLNEKQLAQMFFEYSDERSARKFAQEIVKARNLKQFQTTKELADLLKSVATPGYEHGRIHPATRVFQALRIAVNLEIDNLQSSLPRAAQLLLPGGRMCVITFHSTEDKVVKEFGRKASARPRQVQPNHVELTEVTKKPITASDSEIAGNNRARSAKLRVFERPLNNVI